MSGLSWCATVWLMADTEPRVERKRLEVQTDPEFDRLVEVAKKLTGISATSELLRHSVTQLVRSYEKGGA